MKTETTQLHPKEPGLEPRFPTLVLCSLLTVTFHSASLYFKNIKQSSK